MELAVKNMVEMYNWLVKDQTEDIQIVTNDEGDKLYFYPVPLDSSNKLFSGYFLLDQSEAFRFRDYVSMPNVPLGSVLDYNFNGFKLTLSKSRDQMISIVEGIGENMNVEAAITQFTSDVLKFFSSENVNFCDYCLSFQTDLKTDVRELEDLLISAISYYRDLSRDKQEIYIPKTSPETGNKYYIIPTFIDPRKKTSLANFMVAYYEDLEETIDDSEVLDQRIEISSCVILMIISRQGKLELIDLELKDYQKLDMDEQRSFVLDVLNVIDEINTNDPKQVRQVLTENGLIEI